MKRNCLFAIWLILAASLLLLTGCGKEKTSEPAAPATEPSAEEQLDPVDSEPYPQNPEAAEGYWKYASEPYYLQLTGTYEWKVLDLDGEAVEGGSYDNQNGCVTLYSDGEAVLRLTSMADGSLKDSDGEVMAYCEYPIGLPTPEDALGKSVCFPGAYAETEISYSEALCVAEADSGLRFTPFAGGGTEDAYSDITISFQSRSSYDASLRAGEDFTDAESFMPLILDGLLDTLYSGKVLKSMASEVRDCGSYYQIIGYLWLDSAIFEDAPSATVRGTIEVRYYGTTADVLVGTATALESRIENYFEICSKMLDTCSYAPGGSTAPREEKTPAQADEPAADSREGTEAAHSTNSGSTQNGEQKPPEKSNEDSHETDHGQTDAGEAPETGREGASWSDANGGWNVY